MSGYEHKRKLNELQLEASDPFWIDLPNVNGLNCTGRSTGQTTDLPRRGLFSDGRPDQMSKQEFQEREDRRNQRSGRKV